MKYHFLGKTGVQVSELCLGTMTFAKEVEERIVRDMIDTFIDAGGNFIDTADVYGKTPGASEELVGRALKGKRGQIVLATKVFGRTGPGPNERGLSRLHIMQAVDASLRRLQTDYIDLYYLHSWDNQTSLEESLAALHDLVTCGKVRYIGASNFSARHLMKALCISDCKGWSRFVCFQPQYSLVERSIERELLPLCREEHVGVAVWGPLGGGFLSGKYTPGPKPTGATRLAETRKEQEASWFRKATEKNFNVVEVLKVIDSKRGKNPAQIALSWVRSQPGITAPIIGARTVEQLHDNLHSVEVDLTPEELVLLDEVSKLEEDYPYRVLQRNRR